MKKIIAAILILTILLVNFTACDNSLDDEKTTTETTTEQTTEYTYNNDGLYYYEPEDPTTPVKEWGFYNLDEMGNILIEITGYNLSGDDPYVYFEAKGENVFSSDYWGFDGGYCFDYEIEKRSSIYDLKKTRVLGQYNIIDNDTIALYFSDEGDGSLIIDKRKTVSSFNNFVVFEILSNGYDGGWLIPYSLIDWDRGFVDYKDTRDIETPEELSYKLYLKK